MKERNPAGYKTSKFKEFIENPVAQELLKSYNDGTIKSVKDLVGELEKRGIVIAIPTLRNYMRQIKEVLKSFFFCSKMKI